MKINVKNPLFILAAGAILVTGSTFGATKAVQEYTSAPQAVQFETAEFYVNLKEEQDGKLVSVAGTDEKPGTLVIPALAGVNEGKEELQVNYEYPERVVVENNSDGDFPQYVRVVVDKYWLDEEGNKDQSANPEYITLGAKSDWLKVESEDDKEQTVYYYTKPLAKGEVADLLESVSLDKGVLIEYSKTEVDEDGNKLVTISGYEGKSFRIDVKVDAVQTHHAKDAILGAWGIDVTIDNAGTITSINE